MGSIGPRLQRQGSRHEALALAWSGQAFDYSAKGVPSGRLQPGWLGKGLTSGAVLSVLGEDRIWSGAGDGSDFTLFHVEHCHGTVRRNITLRLREACDDELIR